MKSLREEIWRKPGQELSDCLNSQAKPLFTVSDSAIARIFVRWENSLWERKRDLLMGAFADKLRNLLNKGEAIEETNKEREEQETGVEAQKGKVKAPAAEEVAGAK